MNHSAETYAAPIVGIALASSLVYGLSLYMQPIPVEIFDRAADKHLVSAGDEVTVRWKEVRNAQCASIIYRQLITADGKVIFFEPIAPPEKPVGKNESSLTFGVPPIAIAGTLTYRARSEFQCNPVQRLFGGPILRLPDITLEYVPSQQAQ